MQYIPDGAIIWESAYCDGASGGRIAEVDTRKTRSKKLKIIHEKRDFFTEPPAHYTHQITNPPFSIKKEWLVHSISQGKPFALLLPLATIGAKFFKDIYIKNKEIQVIVAYKTYKYIEVIDGKETNKRLPIPSCFITYKFKKNKDRIHYLTS